MSEKKHPIRNLTAQLAKHDAFTFQNLSKITAFYFKSIMLEPFRLVDKVKYDEAIQKYTPEKDPVFIIGHWRSGTSFLQYLLAQDPQFGYLNKFQAVFPGVFLHSEDFLKSAAKKIPQTLNLTRDAQNMSINLEWDSPSEVEIALTTMLSPASPHWGHIFPKDGWEYFNKYLFFDDVSSAEVRHWKRDYSYLIKKASLKNEKRQMLVKSPGNTSRISALLELYPDARFIFIHRNPYDIFYSNQKLWNMFLNNLALQDFSQEQMEERIIQIYQKLMSRYLEERHLIPSNHLAELQFVEFINDPLVELAAVYKQLDIGGFENAEPEFYTFLESKTDGKAGDYRYENHIIRQLNKEWGFAFKEWNYSQISDLSFAV